MQTFLPYPNFIESARALDWRRLGKQRVEALQIVRALTSPSYGWKRHPATLMWAGHLAALKYYHDVMVREWVARGYRNTMALFEPRPLSCVMPSWVGDSAFHASHRSNLLRKDPEFYSKFGWSEPHDLPYVWPVSDICR